MIEKTTALMNFLELVEANLDVTEPAALDDGCSVVCMAPHKGGLVGLDMDTGRPVRVGWRYKDISEKPVIINAGSRQTVILPQQVAAPALPPPSPLVSITAAGALYGDMKTRFQPSAGWVVVLGSGAP
jgi:hypothetical protein